MRRREKMLSILPFWHFERIKYYALVFILSDIANSSLHYTTPLILNFDYLTFVNMRISRVLNEMTFFQWKNFQQIFIQNFTETMLSNLLLENSLYVDLSVWGFAMANVDFSGSKHFVIKFKHQENNLNDNEKIARSILVRDEIFFKVKLIHI